MAQKRDNWFGRILARRRASPTEVVGVPGVAIYAGFPVSEEISKDLADPEQRYRTYGNILANTPIVAAGVRYFLNTVGAAKWTWTPAEDDASGEYAERLQEMLTEDMATPWERVVRRAAMYRFFGFSVQEWTARRHEDGHYTLADIAPRPQKTIYRWDVDETGKVLGAIQRDPQTSVDLYLPRTKLLYVVDDSLNDGPEGLGLFRHLVAPAKRLERYEQLEGYGFESDLRGVPVGYAPFTELARMVKDQTLDQTDRERIEKPLREFISKHIVTPNRGLLLDSAVYTSEDETGRPINAKQWQVDLLSTDASSFEQNAAAIERLNREIARILGVEQLLLGSTPGGSYALSLDKTVSFHRIVESALSDIREAVDADVVDMVWMINGWPEEMKPKSSTEAVRHQDIAETAKMLADMAAAGAPLEPDDPAINDLRDLAGISRTDLEQARQRADDDAVLRRAELDAMATGQPPAPEPPMPEPAA